MHGGLAVTNFLVGAFPSAGKTKMETRAWTMVSITEETLYIITFELF